MVKNVAKWFYVGYEWFHVELSDFMWQNVGFCNGYKWFVCGYFGLMWLSSFQDRPVFMVRTPPYEMCAKSHFIAG